MTRPLVRVYLDYVSPNAYLAWEAMPALSARHGASVEPVPVLFAGLLEAHGQLGPAEVPVKVRWMWRNCLRKADLLGVPLRPALYHPFNPLLALRVSSLPMEEAARRALVTGLFRAVWAERRHVSEPAEVESVADAAGLEGARLVAEAEAPEGKARVRAQTDAALEAGVFGVPTMTVGEELFWGYDDLPWLERSLAGEDPLEGSAIRDMASRPQPSAMRRRLREEG